MSIDSLAELIRLAMDARQLELHTSLPCAVVSYNAATQRAQLQPLVTRPVPTDDNPVLAFMYEVLPVLHEVPVYFPRGGGCKIIWPLAPGDTVLFVATEADIAGWMATGQLANPDQIERHGLHGGVAFAGIGADVGPLTGHPTAIVVDGPMVHLGGDTPTEFVMLATQLLAWIGQANAAFAAIAAAAGANPNPSITAPTAVPAAATKVKAV
jgi:hypothetical protein